MAMRTEFETVFRELLYGGESGNLLRERLKKASDEMEKDSKSGGQSFALMARLANL